MHHHLLLDADLDHPLGGGPPVFRALVEAVDKLLKGEPDHVDLLAKLDEMEARGEDEPRLPANLVNVIIQADVDRKALMGKSRYPKLKAFILGIKPTHGVSASTSALIARLQEEAREWKQRERVLRSKLAQKDIELSIARRELVQAERTVRNLRAKAAA